jgi:RNA polymerase sigma-70 factor (ECF subfamily)
VKTNKGIIQRFVNFEAAKHPPVTAENFGELYEQHHPEIFRFCRRILRNYDNAEDAAEATFVKAYFHLEKFDPMKASFRTWIFRIAGNECLDRIRKWKDQPLDETVPSENNLTDESQDIQRIVNECLDRLEEGERAPFVLYHLEGFTYEEIAGIMKTSLSTARNRVKSAERNMKACLEKKGADEYLAEQI